MGRGGFVNPVLCCARLWHTASDDKLLLQAKDETHVCSLVYQKKKKDHLLPPEDLEKENKWNWMLLLPNQGRFWFFFFFPSLSLSPFVFWVIFLVMLWEKKPIIVLKKVHFKFLLIFWSSIIYIKMFPSK